MYFNFSILFLLFLSVHSEARQIIQINTNWSFHKGDLDNVYDTADSLWSPVNLPHTWNAADPFDEEPGYFRGVCWYRKSLDNALLNRSGRVFVFFEGANQNSEVFLNGNQVGSHLGGYTAFTFDITDFLVPGNNVLFVKVDNSHDEMVPPLKGDFNFYGGIYRDVSLVITHDVHYGLEEYAASGVYVTTGAVSGSRATLGVRARIFSSQQLSYKGLLVRHTVLDDRGVAVATSESQYDLSSGFLTTVDSLEIPGPEPWSPGNPYCYSIVSEIIDPAGQILDKLHETFGVREFHFDADSGFSINHQHVKLIGVNRHQDYPGKGNALTDEEHLRDVKMIREMGCNFFRTAHYPQDKAVLDACDRLGLVVSMEIPLDHDQTDDEAFYRNSEVMALEMIHQYYNHPSIVIWAYMNEMMLWRNLETDSTDLQRIVSFAKRLEKTIRDADPSRYTMIPNHGEFEIYHQTGLLDIPMIIGWNLYFGWYVEDVAGFGRFLDHAHDVVPGKPIIVSEYGAGAHPGIRSRTPARFDFSQEWETEFHKAHLAQILERPFVAASAVWNMFDFGSNARGDAMPYINNKGLCTFDRQPKDAYHVYRSLLSGDGYLALGGAPFQKWVVADADTAAGAALPVTVFTNMDFVELFIDGASYGRKQAISNAIQWQAELLAGHHSIKVESGEYIDQRSIEFEVVPLTRPFSGDVLHVNVGATFLFRDVETGSIWVEAPASKDGSWGYQAGSMFRPRHVGIGTDRPISGTAIDPVFQTQVIGLEGFDLSLEPGQYKVELLFAELEDKEPGDRSFHIFMNDAMVARRYDIAALAGQDSACIIGSVVQIDSEGKLKIRFESVTGDPVLNGISILRQ